MTDEEYNNEAQAYWDALDYALSPMAHSPDFRSRRQRARDARAAELERQRNLPVAHVVRDRRTKMFLPFIGSVAILVALVLALSGCEVEEKRRVELRRQDNVMTCLKDHTPTECAKIFPPIYQANCKCDCEAEKEDNE